MIAGRDWGLPQGGLRVQQSSQSLLQPALEPSWCPDSQTGLHCCPGWWRQELGHHRWLLCPESCPEVLQAQHKCSALAICPTPTPKACPVEWPLPWAAPGMAHQARHWPFMGPSLHLLPTLATLP